MALHGGQQSVCIHTIGAMDRADDLIDYFKLDTKIFPDYIRHVVRKSDSRKSQDWEMEEIWTCKRLLGKGGSGTVWLQETRETTHKLRAVKELVKKDARVDFKRELLAIAKFSKVRNPCSLLSSILSINTGRWSYFL